MDINTFSNALAQTADNTFVGTLFAGLIIAYSGVWLYRKQKKIDIETLRNEKVHDLAVSLLTLINVAMQDYLGQISLHDGSNLDAKLIYSTMEEYSPGWVTKDTSHRFNQHISNISQALNGLSTPLALSTQNEDIVKTLAEVVASLNFLFSATSTLPMNNPENLGVIRKLALGHSEKARKVLEKIVSGEAVSSG